MSVSYAFDFMPLPTQCRSNLFSVSCKFDSVGAILTFQAKPMIASLQRQHIPDIAPCLF